MTGCSVFCLENRTHGAPLKRVVLKQVAGDGREAAAHNGCVWVPVEHCAAYNSASDCVAERAGDDGVSIEGCHEWVPPDSGVSQPVFRESQAEGVRGLGF